MKKNISILTLAILLIANFNTIKADNLLPSDSYYKEHIAVNDITSKSPGLRAEIDDDDDEGTNPGGNTKPGGAGDSGAIMEDAPIGDALIPFLAATLAYGSFILIKRRKTKKA